MTESAIPCSVQMLTHNSAEGLQACLDSVRSFAEVIIQDGFSTDATRSIAEGFSTVHLIDQDRRFLDGNGWIMDFASMRNLGIAAATYDWILMVDSDEEVEPAMAREVAEIVRRNVPGVYKVFRRFIVNGEPVIHCAGYPAYHIRLFHRSCVDGYIKAIHERLAVHPGITVQIMQSELAVPLPPAASLRPKYDRYLHMEVERLGVQSWGHWFRWSFFRNIRSMLGITVLTAGIWLLPKKGKRMPIAYEWQAVRQLFWTMVLTFPPLAVARKRA